MRVLLILLLAFSSTCLFSQNETNHWYFGKHAGLNFASKISQVLFDGRMIAPAGCASISDLDGNLLFYTDGNIVWNKNHSIMVNGFQIGGDIEVAQNSIIVPVTGNTGIYYIFTVGFRGFSYSVVDINSQGGLGEVIEKSHILILGNGIGKISAVHHDDGQSIWVMTTRKNEDDEYTSFYSYKVNVNGTIDPPVITSSELRYIGLVDGAMKFSPNGERVACANYQTDKLTNHLMIFDFDNQSGIVSRKKDLATSFVQFEVVSAYGIEFSNDSQYLYATLLRQGKLNSGNITEFEDSEGKSLLYQYDLNNLNPWGSITVLHEDLNNLTAGSLQLSKYGSIYRALGDHDDKGSQFLGVINSPNALGVKSNYSHNSIDLIDKESRLGLPNFIQSYFRTRILTEQGCVNNSVPFEVDTYAEITAAEWDFGDGNTSNLIETDHVYTSPGAYDVSVTITINSRQITVFKEVQIYSLPNLLDNQELIQCDTDTDGIANFNLYHIKEKITDSGLNESLFFYENLGDAEQDINRIENPENYINDVANQEIFVRVVNENDCFETTSFSLNATFVELGRISDMIACDGSDGNFGDLMGQFDLAIKKVEIRNELNLSRTSILKFYTTLLDAQTTQNELIGILITSSTRIWARAEDGDLSCNGISPVDLIVNDEPIIRFEDSYAICKGVPIILSGESSNERFEWVNSDNEIISTQQQYTFHDSGTFTHIAYKTQNGMECSNVKDIVIEKPEPPVIKSIKVETQSITNSIEVLIAANGVYEFSLDNINFFGNSNSYTFTQVPPGVYSVHVRSPDDCVPPTQEQIYVMGFPKFFTPNNDGVNDLWKIKGLDRNQYASVSVQIFDRFGKLITTLIEQNNYSWDGRFNGEILPPNDYWFDIQLVGVDDSIIQKRGHFSLVR